MGMRVHALADGTAAAPSLFFADDENTGLFSAANDALSLASAGTEGARLDSTQWNVFRSISNLGATGAPARLRLLAANGGVWELTSVSALVTLNTGGTTTDTASIIPANSVVLALAYRVTTAITTAASYSIGDATTAARFVSGATGLALGSTGVGLAHLQGGVSTDAAGPVFTSASVVRITTNANPGAGAIRVQVWYFFPTAPTS
jgi:hypothetical protein